MEFLKIKDPLDNEIYFDVRSIGLALGNRELSSFTHDIIRKTISSPTAIFEIDKNNRVYLSFTVNSMIQIINAIHNGDFWYVKDVDLDKTKEELSLLIQKYKTIYKK